MKLFLSQISNLKSQISNLFLVPFRRFSGVVFPYQFFIEIGFQFVKFNNFPCRHNFF